MSRLWLPSLFSLLHEQWPGDAQEVDCYGYEGVIVEPIAARR
jgi:hypothetical protein